MPIYMHLGGYGALPQAVSTLTLSFTLQPTTSVQVLIIVLTAHGSCLLWTAIGPCMGTQTVVSSKPLRMTFLGTASHLPRRS